MENLEFGVLKQIKPRVKWNNESSDFTPWLAEHIEELNKALGLELDIEIIEVDAGPYSADILAKDTGTDRYVIIENQLEKTNHDHLGKSLTYASVLDVSTIVWIAPEFTEEYKKALDWLNDHTNDEISFYGVQLELWQIDESRIAVKFNVISQPNQAVRESTRTKSSEKLSDIRKFQFDFWTKFADKLSKTKKIPTIQTPRPESWFDVTLGKSHIHISNTCNRGDNIMVYVFISGTKLQKQCSHIWKVEKRKLKRKLGRSLSGTQILMLEIK